MIRVVLDTNIIVRPQVRSRILGVVCLTLLAGVLYAGLKPFHVPRNQVTREGNGLRLGEHGIVYSSSPLPPGGDEGRSLEIWMEPAVRSDSGTILAFYDPGQPRQFAIHQSDSDLELRVESSAAWHYAKTDRLYVDNAFGDRKLVLWTVASGPSGTTVYQNGGLVKKSPGFRPTAQEFSGKLVIGTSPIFDESWSGDVYGLAIYNRSLSATRAALHYETWTEAGKPDMEAADQCIALYLFAEGSGNLVHNQVGTGADLNIPERYMLLQQTVLDPVWRAFNWHLGFWKDAVINVVGLIPLGFFLCAWLAAKGWSRPALAACWFGLFISLFIELLQTQLPTRDSSMADVINNAVGCWVGAVLYCGFAGRLLDRCLWMVLTAKKGALDPGA